MLDNSIGEEYLQEAGDYDFDSFYESRMAVLCYDNFYRTIMAEIGKQAFNCEPTIQKDSLVEMWEQISPRIEQLDGEFEEFCRYEGIINNKLKPQRNKVAHTTAHNPSREDMTDIEEHAEQFRQWLLDRGEDYQNQFGFYTKAEYQNIEEAIDDLLELEHYSRALKRLYEEVEYAARVALKSEGIIAEPFDKLYGLASISTDSKNAYIAGDQAKQWKALRDTVIRIEEGKEIEKTEAKWHIRYGLSYLENLYKVANPFELQLLVPEDAARSLADQGYNLVNVEKPAGTITVKNGFSIDGVQFDDVEVVVMVGDELLPFQVFVNQPAEELTERQREAYERVRDRGDLIEDTEEYWSFKPIGKYESITQQLREADPR